LLVGIALIAFAVLLGGLAARIRDRAHRFMPALRTFAVVAAASVAVLHLLPEAIEAIGFRALAATGAGLVGPALLERLFPIRGGHEHRAPTTALAIGYAAVIAHQLGEGAALATLARSGALSASVVLAVAAHTVPLAMVVAIGVLEAKEKKDAAPATRAAMPTFLALTGIALATAAGAAIGSIVSASRLATVEPWVLATIAGLLLHALAHDHAPPHSMSRRARAVDAGCGLAGLGLAAIGTEQNGWIRELGPSMRAAGMVAAVSIIIGRSFFTRHAHHDHAGG
jgi:ZIP family zinc transporter